MGEGRLEQFFKRFSRTSKFQAEFVIVIVIDSKKEVIFALCIRSSSFRVEI